MEIVWFNANGNFYSFQKVLVVFFENGELVYDSYSVVLVEIYHKPVNIEGGNKINCI